MKSTFEVGEDYSGSSLLLENRTSKGGVSFKSSPKSLRQGQLYSIVVSVFLRQAVEEPHKNLKFTFECYIFQY